MFRIFFERHQAVGEIERAVHIELLDRRAVVEQHQKLDLGGAEIHRRGFKIGFELDALQVKAIDIDLGEIARLRRWLSIPSSRSQ